MCKLCVVLALCGAVGCGGVSKGDDDAAPDPDDAGPVIDASTETIDAAPGDPDASSTASSPPRKEIGPASGRVTGGGYTVDFQLGHPTEQGQTSGGGYTVEGGAAIKD